MDDLQRHVKTEFFSLFIYYHLFCLFQFCECLKSLILDQRSVLLTALLGLLSMGYLGISSGTALPALLVPFTLWMAS